MSASQAMINDLKSRVGTLEAKLRDAKVALDDAIGSTCRAQPGDIIEASNGLRAKVWDVVVKFDRPEPVAHLQKADGSFGLRQASMFRKEWRDYTVVKKEPTP